MHENVLHRNIIGNFECASGRRKKKQFENILTAAQQVKTSHLNVTSGSAETAPKQDLSHTSSPEPTLPCNISPATNVNCPAQDSFPEDLIFEKESSTVDFETEPIYDLETMHTPQKAYKKPIPSCPPPPDFQTALKAFPANLAQAFKNTLHGEFIGIWPIKNDALIHNIHQH